MNIQRALVGTFWKYSFQKQNTPPKATELPDTFSPWKFEENISGWAFFFYGRVVFGPRSGHTHTISHADYELHLPVKPGESSHKMCPVSLGVFSTAAESYPSGQRTGFTWGCGCVMFLLPGIFAPLVDCCLVKATITIQRKVTLQLAIFSLKKYSSAVQCPSMEIKKRRGKNRFSRSRATLVRAL